MDDVLNLRKKIEEKLPPKKEVIVTPKKKIPEKPVLKTEIIDQPKTDFETLPPEEVKEDEGGGEISWTLNAQGKTKKHQALGLVLVLAGILLWILMSDPLFSLVLIIGGIAFVLGLNERASQKVTVSDEGIRVGDRVYPYEEIESYSIALNPNKAEVLSIKLKSWYTPVIRIPIQGVDPVNIDDLVIAYIPEKEHEYSWVDVIASRFGF